MLESVTCYWINDIARDLFERYERHLAEVEAMLTIPAEMRGASTVGSASALDANVALLCKAIKQEMTELVRNFAVPAVAIPNSNQVRM